MFDQILQEGIVSCEEYGELVSFLQKYLRQEKTDLQANAQTGFWSLSIVKSSSSSALLVSLKASVVSTKAREGRGEEKGGKCT